jgi:hypothetical protein
VFALSDASYRRKMTRELSAVTVRMFMSRQRASICHIQASRARSNSCVLYERNIQIVERDNKKLKMS